MKPKTKLQKRVAELSRKLNKISEPQKRWAFENCFERTGYLRRKTIWCLECGNTFEPENSILSAQLLGVVCPCCGKELKVENSRNLKFEARDYYTIVTTSQEFQVLRHFVVSKNCRVGSPAEFEINEAVQNWFAHDGKRVDMSRTASQSIYYDLWDWYSDMEVRGKSAVFQKYNVFANHIYPRMNVTELLKRNGFDGNFHGIMPQRLFTSLLQSSRMETLIKAKQYGLLKYFAKEQANDAEIDKYWQAVKICIRNNYTVTDGGIWRDYVNLLLFFNKDISNAKYVCPDNLKQAHDRYVEKKRKVDEKLALEEKKKKALEENEQFLKLKGRYIGIAFSDGNIDVKVLDNVLEYVFEGEKLNHCVYASDYHLKPNSLILSARIDGKPVETIEISLKDFSILQCCGRSNQITEHHSQIKELVSRNIHLIREKKAV